jgi:predicted HAD superfamily Cof-like phosphohydrolase
MTDAELVCEFTTESGTKVPNHPQLMTKDEVFFLIKMMLDEIMELGATVSEPHEVKFKMIKMITDSKDLSQITEVSKEELIGEQGDALVDSYYYSLNAAAKKGINLSKIFEVVHKANMNKRDPTTGKFLKREDGKIIKPIGWKEPDITGEIKRQFKEGSFESV